MLWILFLMLLNLFSFSAQTNSIDNRLFNAIKEGDKDKVLVLIREGANVNAQYGEYMITPLHYAAQIGRRDIVDILISNKAIVYAKDIFGSIPLHYAANKDIAEYLVSKLAGISAKNDFGDTPIHVASANGRKEVLKCLFDNNEIDIENNFYFTPLHWAVVRGQKDTVEYLLSKGASVYKKNLYGNNALDLAVIEDKKEIIDLFSSLKFEVNLDNKNPNTIFLRAVGRNDFKLIMYLLLLGLDINQINIFGVTPLSEAVSIDLNNDVIKYLVSKGATVNTKDWVGETPLHAAVWRGNIENIEYLLSKGANVNARLDEDLDIYVNDIIKITFRAGDTPLDIAIKKKHKKIIRILKRNCGKQGKDIKGN